MNECPICHEPFQFFSTAQGLAGHLITKHKRTPEEAQATAAWWLEECHPLQEVKNTERGAITPGTVVQVPPTIINWEDLMQWISPKSKI